MKTSKQYLSMLVLVALMAGSLPACKNGDDIVAPSSLSSNNGGDDNGGDDNGGNGNEPGDDHGGGD